MNDIIGKTVAGVEVQQWAGTDTFKDTVTWERTVITFTDETTTAFDAWDGEVYDPYQAVFDDDGQPQELVIETTACRHCGHGIGQARDGTWVAPDAGFDVEGGDGMWRDMCPDRDDEINPPHEPVDQDVQNCIQTGEHQTGTQHRWQECPVYHDEES